MMNVQKRCEIDQFFLAGKSRNPLRRIHAFSYNKTMKIFICDDEKAIVDELMQMCNNYMQEKNIQAEITGGTSFPENMGEEGSLLDLLLLDIDMPGESGISIKNRMEAYEDGPYIIFITSHKEMVYEAFGRNVLGFLEKPVSRELFDRYMDRGVTFCEDRYLSVELPDGIRLRCSEIIGIKVAHIYTSVVTTSGCYDTRRSLNQWEKILPQGAFVRANEKWIVHYAHVGNYTNNGNILLTNGETLTVSRRKKPQFQLGFLSYISKKGKSK